MRAQPESARCATWAREAGGAAPSHHNNKHTWLVGKGVPDRRRPAILVPGALDLRARRACGCHSNSSSLARRKRRLNRGAPQRVRSAARNHLIC